MKKILFSNEIFFPNLNPPIGIVFKDILKLIFRNGLRTLVGALIIGLLILTPSTIFISIFEDSPYEKYYGKFAATIIIIWASLLGIYFLISIIYTIYKSWQWYIFYLKNLGKGNFINKYETEIYKLSQKLKKEFLEEKLTNNNKINIQESYLQKENEIFSSLKKEYVTKFIKKNKYVNTFNIDENIKLLNIEFDKLINRQKTINY